MPSVNPPTGEANTRTQALAKLRQEMLGLQDKTRAQEELKKSLKKRLDTLATEK